MRPAHPQKHQQHQNREDAAQGKNLPERKLATEELEDDILDRNCKSRRNDQRHAAQDVFRSSRYAAAQMTLPAAKS